MNDKKYVVAVSGGVDSMVLLDSLTHQGRLAELVTDCKLHIKRDQLVVAHFDHGIRGDSAEDEQLVRGVAEKHGLSYESTRVELGKETSEDTARKERYKFLRQCCNKYNAQLITAHHQDDVIETIIINLIRGTGWRGLAPMIDSNFKDKSLNSKQNIIHNSQFTIHRPFLNVTKEDILAYAKKYGVTWREDSTNTDTTYLRNYIRHTILLQMQQRDAGAKEKLIKIYTKQADVKKEIATELQKLTTNYKLQTTNYIVPRYDIIMSPSSVALELIYYIVTNLDPDWHPNTHQLQRTCYFIKAAHIGKSMDVTGRVKVVCDMRMARFCMKEAQR